MRDAHARADQHASGRHLRMRGLSRVLRARGFRPGIDAACPHRRWRCDHCGLCRKQCAGSGSGEFVAGCGRRRRFRRIEIDPGSSRISQCRNFQTDHAQGAERYHRERWPRCSGRRPWRSQKTCSLGHARVSCAGGADCGFRRPLRHLIPKFDRRLGPREAQIVCLLRSAGRREWRVRYGGWLERFRECRFR